MENANPPPTSNRPVLPAVMLVQAIQELHELQRISAFVDSRLESIKRFLNNFANQPNETNMNDLESDDESVDTPLVSSFPHSDNDSDDEEVLNELSFRKFTAYLDPFLPMNIISRKAYNTIMVDGLEGTGRNLVAIVRDVYVFFYHHAVPTVPGIATIPVVLEDVIVISDEENEDIPLDFIVISDEEDSSDEESEDIPLDVIVISIDDEPEMSAKTVATQVPVLGRKRVFSLIDESDNDEEYWSIAFLF
ncbi:hypothetical protein Tco_0295230 [Tanacetum coccineum]